MENLSMGMKLFLFIVAMVISILAGVVLSRTGKPYHTLLFTVHKLVAIAGLVFMIVLLSAYIKGNPANSVLILFAIAGAVGFLGILLSGALMSLDRLVVSMQLVHKLSTVVYVLASSGLMWKILSGVPVAR